MSKNRLSKNRLITVLWYDKAIVGLFLSRSLARIHSRRLVLECDYKIDKFYFEDLPLQ